MKKSRQTLIFLLYYISYSVIYIARLNLAAASTPMEALGVFTLPQYGVVTGTFSVVYAFGRFFNGVLADRIHPAAMISIGLALTAVGNLGVGLFPPYVCILLLWAVNAYGQSMLWSSILRSIAAVYGDRAKAVTAKLSSTIAVGNITAILLNGWMISAWGVRFAFLIPGVLAALCCVASGVVLPRVECPPAPRKGPFPLAELLRDRDILRILPPAFLHGVIKDNVSYWIFSYLSAVYLITPDRSPLFAVLIPVMGLAGRMAFPYFYQLLGGREHSLSARALLACALVSLPLLWKTSVLLSSLCLGLIYGLTSMVNVSILSIFPMSYADRGHVASVSGLTDLAAYLGCALGSYVYGITNAAFGYRPMFASWIALSLLAWLLYRPLRAGEKTK